MPRRLLILCALVLTQVGCSAGAACQSQGDSADCTRVLFVGNSYTYVNDLPAMFATLATSGGHSVETGMLASARWGVVVLQEQSEIPSINLLRQGEMYPAARRLVRMIRDAGARPIFFLTWAHRDGWPAYGMADYSSMQSAIDDAYLAIAGTQNAGVAPVGYAPGGRCSPRIRGPVSGKATAATLRRKGHTWQPVSSTQPSSGRARRGSPITPTCRMTRPRHCRESPPTWPSTVLRPGDCADDSLRARSLTS